MAALTKRRTVASLDNVSRLCYYCLKRSISSKKFYSSDATVPPLNIALPGVYSDNLKNGNMSRKGVTACKDVQVTTLSNGVKVASEESFGPFCTLGGFCIFLLLESYVNGFTIGNPTLPPRLQSTYVHKPTLQPHSCYNVEVNSFRPRFSPSSANLNIFERKSAVTKRLRYHRILH